jgi:hypothetical protein
MSTFVGPHTAETQRQADRLAEICREREHVVASHVAAQLVAEDVLEGDDPWPQALVYDACERDLRWVTSWMIAAVAS